MSRPRPLGVLLMTLGALAMLVGSLVAASGASLAIASGVGTDTGRIGGWQMGWTIALTGWVAFLAGSFTHARARGFA